MTNQSGEELVGEGFMLLERDAATSASELMYFAGAPLAHVVHYEEEQRAKRLRGACSDKGFLWMRIRRQSPETRAL